MFSKVYCYNEKRDLEQFKEYIKNKKESFELICDNLESKKYLIDNGYNAKILDDFFPRYSDLQYKMFEKTKISFLRYEDVCKQIKFNNYSVNTGLLHNIIEDLLYLEKIKNIFENKINKFFICKKITYRNLIIQKIATEKDFENDNKIVYVIKNGSLYGYNLFETIENLEKSQILKYKKSFSIYSKNLSQSSNKISFVPKLAKKVIPMILRLSSSKIYEMKPDMAIKSILKNVENKIDKDNHLQYGFFLSSDKENLFETYYEIFKRFSDAKIPFEIFTIDPITSSFSEKKDLPLCEFFEEIHILANVLKKTNTAKKFEEQLKKVTISENLLLVYNETMNLELMDRLYRVFATSMILEHVLKKMNLKNAIIIDGTMLGSVVADLGNKINFPTTSIETLLIDNNAILSLLIKANKICTYGIQGQRSLMNLGISGERISVTGNPKYDYIKSQDTISSKKILKQKYNIDDEKRIITVAMSRWHSNDEQWISNFIKFCNKNNAEIIIKLHPRYKRNPEESQNQINFIKKECKKNKFFITFDMKLSLLLSGSDLVISDYSNVGVEAVMLKKIVINQNFIKEDLEVAQNYHKIEAVLYTEEYDELEKIVKEILQENKFKKQLEKGYEEMVMKYNLKNDGKASERIFNVLTGNLK